MVMLELFVFVVSILHGVTSTPTSSHHSSYDLVMTDASDQPTVVLSMEVDTAFVDECDDGDSGAPLDAHEHAGDDHTDLLLLIHHGRLQI